MVLSTRFWFKVDYSFPIMFCRDRMVVGFTTTCAICTYPGADPGFQDRGDVFKKKMRRAEGGAKIFGVFRVKNHDFTPKNHIFSDFRGGTHRVRPLPPPESALAITTNIVSLNPVHGEVYSIQYHVIKFVSDFSVFLVVFDMYFCFLCQ